MSYGPETATIYHKTDGVYSYSVHDYSNLRKAIYVFIRFMSFDFRGTAVRAGAAFIGNNGFI